MYPKLNVLTFLGAVPAHDTNPAKAKDEHLIHALELDGVWVGKLFEHLVSNATAMLEQDDTFRVLTSAFGGGRYSTERLRIDLDNQQQLVLFAALANIQVQVLNSARIKAEKTLHRMQMTADVGNAQTCIRSTMQGSSNYMLRAVMQIQLVLQDSLAHGYAFVLHAAPKKTP